ncbi:MAG: UPF0149 family protein [Thiolinea sp.]
MLNSKLPDFYALEDALLRLDADFSASEVHGIQCAVLGINQDYDKKALQSHLVKGDPQDFHFQETIKLLGELHEFSRQQLNSGDLQFELLLPDDQDELANRLLALQKWCQGFAFGLALSGLGSMNDLPEDSREWVQDVIKIGASGEFDLEDEEASEQALLDLNEFLRVGMLMMNEEVQPLRGMPVAPETQDTEEA